MSTLKVNLLKRFQLTHIEEEVLGERVFIKQLSASEAEGYQLERMNPKTGEVDFSKFGGARADLVALCFCEEDGLLMFKNGTEAGGSLPTSFIDAAYKVCAAVNGMNAGNEGEEEPGKD